MVYKASQRYNWAMRLHNRKILAAFAAFQRNNSLNSLTLCSLLVLLPKLLKFHCAFCRAPSDLLGGDQAILGDRLSFGFFCWEFQVLGAFPGLQAALFLKNNFEIKKKTNFWLKNFFPQVFFGLSWRILQWFESLRITTMGHLEKLIFPRYLLWFRGSSLGPSSLFAIILW